MLAVAVQSQNIVLFFVTSWILTHQAPLSSTISQSLLNFMSIELVMLSNHLILCHPLLLLPCIFPVNRLFTSGGQNTAASASATVLPKNIESLFPLRWTVSISWQSKWLSIVHRARKNNFTICKEIQKTSNSQSNLEKEEWNWRNQPAWLQALLQSHSHQDSMVLAQRHKYRSMEQNRKPRDKSTHLWTPYLWQRRQGYTMEKRQSL